MQSGTTSRLVALCFDANDPLRLARFWADALRRNWTGAARAKLTTPEVGGYEIWERMRLTRPTPP